MNHKRKKTDKLDFIKIKKILFFEMVYVIPTSIYTMACPVAFLVGRMHQSSNQHEYPIHVAPAFFSLDVKKLMFWFIHQCPESLFTWNESIFLSGDKTLVSTPSKLKPKAWVRTTSSK